MRLAETLYDQTGSGKSNMAAAKTEVLITRLADQELNFNGKTYFSGFPNSMKPISMLYDQTGSGKSNMAEAKTEVLNLSLQFLTPQR